MTQNSETGKLGEDTACEFLRENGFRVLFRNERNKFGEIDIVARDHDRTLVFVEVKTIRQSSWQAIRQSSWQATRQSGSQASDVAEFMPEDQMSDAKTRKFRRSAEFFANGHPELIRDEAGWRLDFIGVIFDGAGDHTIRQYKNIA